MTCQGKIVFPGPVKRSCARGGICYLHACPISHVPVVACRLVGIRTRGRTAARRLGNAPATCRAVFQGRRKTRGLRYLTGSRRLTGELCPPQRTRLEATTIGLFWSQLVSRASYRRGLFFLPAVRRGGVPNPIEGVSFSDGCPARLRKRCLGERHRVARANGAPSPQRTRTADAIHGFNPLLVLGVRAGGTLT